MLTRYRFNHRGKKSIDLCILYTNRIEFLIIAIETQNVVYLIRVIICFLSIECQPCVEFRSIVKKCLTEKSLFTIEIFRGFSLRATTNDCFVEMAPPIYPPFWNKRSIDHRVKLYSLIIVHCYPARIFWTRSFIGFVHARTRLFDVRKENGNISSESEENTFNGEFKVMLAIVGRGIIRCLIQNIMETRVATKVRLTMF